MLKDRSAVALYDAGTGDPILVGTKTAANSIPVTLASDEWLTTRPSTGTQSIVADAATSTTILAANASRKGASVYNDSTEALYLLVGAGTASPTVFTALVSPGGYYEVPFGYTGILVGIWAANASGSARVMEFT